MADDAHYANIREPGMLGPIMGQRVVDITQHDKDDWERTHETFVMLHFENGVTVTFPIGEPGFNVENVPE